MRDMGVIYLDYNATSPVRPEVVEAMQLAMQHPTNASSVHALGRKARQQVEDARSVVADFVSAWANEVIFTSSGSEANNHVLRAFADRPILVAATEHPSVLTTAQRLGGDILPVDAQGMVQLDVMEAKLKALGRPALVSVMLANNETGVIQPINEISRIAKQYDALVHSDAVQAVGKIDVDMGVMGVDMLTICGHKCGGPIGVGALVVRNDLSIKPFITGGGQELGRRAGTENVPAILGFARMLELVRDRSHMRDVENWMADMEAEITRFAPEATVFGDQVARLPNTCCITMPNVSSETQLMSFDLEGFALSAGSACSSGRMATSPVLLAMGADEEIAANAIRISAGWQTQQSDLAAFVSAWKKTYTRLAKKAA